MVLSNRQRSASRRSGISAKLLRPGGEAVRFERSADRRADDRRFTVLPGRPLQRAAPSRAHARSLSPCCREVAYHSLPKRPAGDCPRGPCADPVASGICGSVDARSRKQCRGRSGGQSHKLTVLRSVPGGMSDRTVGRRSGCGRTLRDDAGRPFDKACAGALASLGRSYQGVLFIERGDSATGLRLLRAGLDELGDAKFAALRLVTFLMAEALARAGRIADGLAM